MTGPDGFVVGIDFGGTKVAIAAVTGDGCVLVQDRIDVRAELGAEQAVERALVAARALMAEAVAVSGLSCLGAGVCSPGIILEDRVLLAPNVPGWQDLALPKLVREGLKLDGVVVCTDVKAAATAETCWGALRGAEPGLYLNLGTGLAAAVVVGGHVLMGAHGAAGEIGYNLVSVADDAGPLQGRAPLEERVGGLAIGRRGARYSPDGAEGVFRAAESNPEARAFLDETLGELALHVANAAIMVDPSHVALGGGLMNAAGVILPVVRDALRRAVPFPPEVVPALFTYDAAVRGAAAIAFERLQP
jgi:glucokinase